MSASIFAERLRSGSSILVLSTLALLGASSGRPAFAQSATTISDVLFGGGSAAASLVLRQVFDCYAGITVGTGAGADGYSYSSSFNSPTPTPGLLPTPCTTASTPVEGLYAGVGGGNGLRGFISNRADQLFLGKVTNTTYTQWVSSPALPPQFIDNNNVNATIFGVYPYPRVDFFASEAPLPSPVASLTTITFNATPASNWQSGASVTVTRANTTSTVAYSTASYGQPIQLPLFEAPLAIAVNLPEVSPSTAQATVGSTIWTIKSQFSSTAPGGVIQLSTAQMCAIFSGLVTDWNSTATIPYIRSDGSVSVQSFDDDNTYHATSVVGWPGTGATAYTSYSKPITIVYRADDSGATYILTNYLKTVCPLLDPTNTYKYLSIFSSSNLPSNNFGNLIANVANGRGINFTSWTHPHPWIGVWGDVAAASAIGNASNAPTQVGRIGYIGNNFAMPYNAATTAPASASIQNDWDRAWGVYHPGQTSISTTIPGTQNFAAPTPAGADAAWWALWAWGISPATTWTYQDYNIYAKVFPSFATLVNSNGVKSIGGRSILPLAHQHDAYPLVGTAYGFFYSCYGTGADGVSSTTRVTNLKAYLNWHYTNAQAADILANNGFHALPSNWASNINSEYLGSTNIKTISAYPVPGLIKRGCIGATGGAG